MPTHKSNKKRLRQDKLRRLRNRMTKSRLRTLAKKFEQDTLLTGAKEETLEPRLREMYKFIDQASRRRIIHPNTAARRKSRMASLLNRCRAKAGVA